MGDDSSGKIAFALERLNRKGPDALAYRHEVQKLKRHVEQALKDYRTRCLGVRVEAVDDERVLTLFGTLPVTYRGSEYNIPVSIVVPADYPILAPQAFVEPTPDMELVHTAHQSPYRVHAEAGTRRGRVDTATAWAPDHSSLIDVIIDLCRLFGEVPPVKARRTAAQPPAPPAPAVAASPYGVVDRPTGVAAGSAAYPAYPTRPLQGAMAGAYPQGQATSSAANPYATANPYPQPAPSLQNPYAAHNGYPQAAQPNYSGMPAFNQPPAPPGAAAPTVMTQEAAAAAFKRKAVDVLTQRIVDSLEQSCAALEVQVAQLESKSEKLAEHREALSAAKKSRVEQLQAVEENTSRLCIARQQLGAWLSENESKGRHLRDDLAPEDVIVASDALSAQAIQAQAADMAIEECFDVLASALNTGAVELDVYVKSLRLLAEDQYRCRLLGMKIQEKQRQQARPRSAEVVQLPQGDAWRSTATYPS